MHGNIEIHPLQLCVMFDDTLHSLVEHCQQRNYLHVKVNVCCLTTQRQWLVYMNSNACVYFEASYFVKVVPKCQVSMVTGDHIVKVVRRWSHCKCGHKCNVYIYEDSQNVKKVPNARFKCLKMVIL